VTQPSAQQKTSSIHMLTSAGTCLRVLISVAPLPPGNLTQERIGNASSPARSVN
jgi:hypothetical protein